MNAFVNEQFQSRCEMISFSSPQKVHLGSSEIFILINKWLVGSILWLIDVWNHLSLVHFVSWYGDL